VLEALDSIDWNSVGPHVYGDNDTIPAQIRDLLSEDPRIGGNALEFLFGGGQDIGAIYASTAYIVPFMIEILADGQSPVCTEILESLATVTRSKLSGGRPHFIQEVRQSLKTYDAAQRGMTVYLIFLQSHNENHRAAAAKLLGQLGENAASILPILRDRFTIESVTAVQIALIEGMENLLLDQDYLNGWVLRREYAPFFQQIIKPTDDPNLQYTVVSAAIRTAAIDHNKHSNEVTALLGSVLMKCYWSQPDIDWPVYFREQVVELLALLPDIAFLLQLLNHPDTTPEEAHLIGRGLLAHHIDVHQQDEYWRYSSNIWEKEEIIYEPFYIEELVRKEFSKSQEIRNIDSIFRVLYTLVNADKFWQIPTNLFSSMVALPDEREKLALFIQEWG
jgi:hypothetical protein